MKLWLFHPDDTRLGATLRRGRGDQWVVIGGATGVPQGYYGALAQWLCDVSGVNVLTFDYRGMGASRRGALKGFQAHYRDWASDLAEAIGYAADRGPTVVVGHSFGGHAFGMTDAHARTRGLYTFGTGAGWHGYMKRREGLKVQFMWNVLMPTLVAWRGYLPAKLVGLGEDLPLGVYQDWKRWCSSPHYFFDDPEAEFTGRFAEVTVPVVGVNSMDDPWANPASAAAFLSHYPNVTMNTVKPSDIRVSSIGHMAYVRPSCKPLWHELGDWIEERLTTDSALQ